MGKLKNMPKLRFPEFKEEWQQKKLGEVVEFKVTNSFSRENLNYEIGSVKNIHYGDIHTKFQTLFDITREEVPFINEDMNVKRISEDFYCKEGDIIFADASEDLNDVGKSIEITNLNNEKLLSGLHTLLARPKANHFHIGFNGYLFKSGNIRLQIQKEAQGSKVLSVNVSRISNINLSYPTLPEQTKIASFLISVDKKLQELKQKKNLLEHYKKGVMQLIFQKRIRFKDKNGKAFPNWEKKLLGEVFFAEKGKGISKNKITENGLYSCILYGELYTKYNEVIFEVISKTNEIDGLKSKIGDLLIPSSTTTTGIDLANVTALNIDDVLLGGDITVLRSNETTNNVFFAYYLSNHKKQDIANLAQGITIVHLYYSHLKDMEIEIPNYLEQTKIADFLSAIDVKLNHTKKLIINTEIYKKALLQNLFI
jgi:type I restriction enzyme S subunit